jgi:hypothetical protein
MEFKDDFKPFGFRCVSCKRYFPSHYFDTGPGWGDNKDIEEHGEYWFCAYCDRKGGDSPDNPFYWDDKVPWPYPEDITKDKVE